MRIEASVSQMSLGHQRNSGRMKSDEPFDVLNGGCEEELLTNMFDTA